MFHFSIDLTQSLFPWVILLCLYREPQSQKKKPESPTPQAQNPINQKPQPQKPNARPQPQYPNPQTTINEQKCEKSIKNNPGNKNISGLTPHILIRLKLQTRLLIYTNAQYISISIISL